MVINIENKTQEIEKINTRAALWLLNLSSLFFIYRVAVPSFKYLFVISFGFLVVYSIITLKQNWILFVPRIRSILMKNIVVAILILYLFFAFLLTDKLYISVIKDLLNILVLSIVVLNYYFLISSKEKLKYTLKSLVKLQIYFAIFISVFLLLDLFDIYSINKSYIIDNPDAYIDNNFSLIPVFFGLISVFFLMAEQKSQSRKIGLNMLLLFLSVPVLFSGSRRGLILFGLIYSVALVLSILYLFRIKNFSKRDFLNFGCFPISIPILVFILIMFFLGSSYFAKNKLFDLIGTKNKELVRTRLAARFSRVARAYDKELNYNTVYNSVWKNVFDPKNPDSGWGTRIHKNVYPLTGANVEIVPENSIGYMMDNSCDASYYDNVNVSEAYSPVFNLKVKNGEHYRVSVYCYLSADFDGSEAYLMLGDNDAFYEGFRRANYQLNKFDTWQKLEIEFSCVDGNIPVYIAFMKRGVKSFSDLKGYIIFAYPQFEKIDSINYTKLFNSLIDPKDPQSGWGGRNHKRMFPLVGRNSELIPSDCVGYKLDSTCNASYYSDINASEAFSLLYHMNVRDNAQYKVSVFCFVSKDFDGTSAYIMLGDSKAYNGGIRRTEYDLLRKDEWQKLELNFICNDGIIDVYLSFLKRNAPDFSKMKGFVVFAYPQIEKVYNSKKTNISLTFLMQENKKTNHFTNISCNYSKDLKNGTFIYDMNMIRTKKMSIISFLYILNNNSCDPLNEWLTSLIKKDSTYRELKKIKIPERYKDEFGLDRIERWIFAKDIFFSEYSETEKIFGGGFYFLSWYSKAFSVNNKIDYPHNPFLYILLYSGIIGLSLYVVLIYQVFRNYINRIREYYMLFIFFLITYYFSFFSGGDPFDPPMLGYFILISFLINYEFNENKIENK